MTHPTDTAKSEELKAGGEQPETPEMVLRRSLQRLERAATEVARLGAVTGPQWPKLTDALIKARVALMTTPKRTVA